jgi:hypothetical protein
MNSSQSRREAMPALASTFCNRSALNATSFFAKIQRADGVHSAE